ncbi:phosphatidylserine decarboxylase [Halovulum sp. GXIMD14793]
MKMHETVLKPMHPEGWRFVGIFAVITLALFWLWGPLGWVGLLLTIWCYYFFRDPVRQVPQRDGLIVSPADGVVSMIEQATPPAELEVQSGPLTRISVFMSVFNVHVNRTPTDGVLKRMVYKPGKFFNAALDKASEDNERNSLVLTLPDGRSLIVVQIAGLVARRILPFVKEGDALVTGQRFGLIRFGSRLDIYLPNDVAPLVAVGQTMIAGETVLADLSLSEPPRPVRAD